MSNKNPTPTYIAIKTEAQQFATAYKIKHSLPTLPSSEEVAKYHRLLKDNYPQVITLVQKYLEQFSHEFGHGIKHLYTISAQAGWIANHECQALGIEGSRKEMLVATAVVAGFLHDIDRHLGFGAEHMRVGAQTAQSILDEAGVLLPDVVTVVAHHDEPDFNPTDENLAIVFGAVFDADHFVYGLERESDFWRIQEEKGNSPEEAIHNYAFVLKYVDAWKTTYGKEVGPQFIQFGLAIAYHIEEVFGASPV